MAFILFLIVILLLVNGLSIFKFMYRMALFTIMLSVMALASYFIFSSAKADDLSQLQASAHEKVISVRYGDKSNELKKEIRLLRIEIKKSESLAEKKMLTKHLQHLETLMAQQGDAEKAIENMKADRVKIKELQELRNSLNKRKNQFEQDAKRLEDLNRDIKRSEKLIEKLNEFNSTAKGIQHD